MKSTNLFWWICVCLLSASSLRAAEQNEHSDSLSFKTAEAYFAAGDFYSASIAYERLGFYSTSNTEKTQALLGKAECLKKRSQYKEAEQVLNRINYEGMNDTMTYQSRYQSALCGYLAGSFTNAESQLQQLFFYTKDSSITRSALPLYALILNEERRWEEAHLKLSAAIQQASGSRAMKDSLQRIVDQVYEKQLFPKLKSINKAQILDAIVPGAGHIYAGYFWEGTASFGLNLAALAFLGYTIYTGYYITSFTVGTTIMQMFYVGGMNRSEILVNKHNYESKNLYNERIKNNVLGIQSRIR